jgi:hypothetical protein
MLRRTMWPMWMEMDLKIRYGWVSINTKFDSEFEPIEKYAKSSPKKGTG